MRYAVRQILVEDPAHPQQQIPVVQLDNIPLQRDQLGNSKAVAIGNKNDGRVTMAVPSNFRCCLHQPVDFFVRQVFTWTDIAVFRLRRW